MTISIDLLLWQRNFLLECVELDPADVCESIENLGENIGSEDVVSRCQNCENWGISKSECFKRLFQAQSDDERRNSDGQEKAQRDDT